MQFNYLSVASTVAFGSILNLGIAPSACAEDPSYVLIETSTLFDRSDVMIVDINDHGHIVANQRTLFGYQTAPLYRNQTSPVELPQLPDQSWAEVTGINNEGLIIGVNYTAGFAATGTLWISGEPSTTEALMGINGIPTAINDQGDLAGWMSTDSVPQDQWGFTWLDGTATQFNENYEYTGIDAINTDQIVVGSAQVADSQDIFPFYLPGETIRRIGSSGGRAHDINDNGQIAGSLSAAGTGVGIAFRYRLSNDPDRFTSLHPSDASSSIGSVIAADGTVYGTANYPNFSSQAMILDGDNSIALSSLTIGADQAQLNGVEALNAHGWLGVFGPADLTEGGRPHYLLVPRTLASSTFTNLSVRSELRAEQPLIVGTSTIGGTRQLLVRGVGPSLATYLPAETATAGDPNLVVYDASATAIAANDNWVASGSTADAIEQAQAFPLNADSTDAAIVVSVDGLASAHANNTGETGVGLVELFDLDQSDTSKRLVNLSARYEVGTGDDILIGGFILSGSGPKTVLLRGIGPALEGFGVDGVLADPEIVLFDGAGQVIARNDNWSNNLGSVFETVGAFGLVEDSLDAAMVLPLWPGIYTIHLRGADGGTGQGLIEIYDLDL